MCELVTATGQGLNQFEELVKAQSQLKDVMKIWNHLQELVTL